MNTKLHLIILSLGLAVAFCLIPTSVKAANETPPLEHSGALAQEAIGSTIPITLNIDGKMYVGRMVIRSAYQGRYAGHDGIVVSGEVYIPISPSCTGGSIMLSRRFHLAFMDLPDGKRNIFGRDDFSLTKPYVVRNVRSFSCTTNLTEME